jgi:DNA polymerase I-like protein with 3'-5' exonuclease and polymerase domains
MMTATRNGTFPHDARTAAELYLQLGLAPIPLPPRTKNPVFENWQKFRMVPASLDEHFPPGEARNIGVLNGSPSGNVVDVDLDCAHAIKAADLLLPPTGWIFGRASAPQSHRIYRSDPPLQSAQREYCDLDGTMLVELRGTSGQTVYPPSSHEDTGERITWDSFTEPAEVSLADLRRDVRKVAAAALLARHYPKTGSRDKFALALTGALVRAGWAADDVSKFVEAVAVAADDEELRKRSGKAPRSEQKLKEGKKVTGWPKLVKTIGPNGGKVVRRVRLWLGLKKPKQTKPTGRISAASMMVQLVQKAGVQLFHASDERTFAHLPVGDHHETWPLRSQRFRTWMSHLFYRSQGKAPGGQALSDALNVLEGVGLHEGPAIPTYLRVAGYGGKLYLDLADTEWRAVEIDVTGWRLVKEPPVRFRRPKGMLALPEPIRGGSLKELRPLVNVRDEANWLLLIGWLVGALRDRGPYPVLALAGEQGTAKTTLGRFLRRLLDPSVTMLRSDPRDTRDLMIAAHNGWLVGYDNLSDLPPWLSDALCRLATGGGFGTRQLYTDEEEMLFDSVRPVVLTSIADVVTSPDLLDRSIFLRLVPIPEEQRLTEEELDARFNALWPRILGALCDAVSIGLRTRSGLRPRRLPRMADFALFAEAVCRGLGHEPEAFLKALETNRRDTDLVALDTFLIVPVLRRLVEQAEFTGTATELLVRLNEMADEATRKQRGWPARPNILSNQLRRVAPNLRRSGIEVDLNRGGRDGRRAIHLALLREEDRANSSSASSAPSAEVETNVPADDADDADDGLRSSSSLDPASEAPVADDADDADDPLRSCSSQMPSGQTESPYAENTCSEAAGPAYQLVQDQVGLDMVAAALDGSSLVGLDVETTGLDPKTSRVRLLSLACDTIDGGTFTYLIDCSVVDPFPLWEPLAERELVLHNGAFDLAMLAQMGFSPRSRVHDTMVLSQVLHAGCLGLRHRLGDCVQRELGRFLDKTEQTSNWGCSLTPDQLRYAALDAFIVRDLLKDLLPKLQQAGLAETAALEGRCLPGLVWLRWSGMAFDREAWTGLATAAKAEVEELEKQLDAQAPPRNGHLSFDGVSWNWDSPEQVLEALRTSGSDLPDSTDESLAAADHPLAELLRKHRGASKRAGTYGGDWLQHVSSDGRVYSDWRQLGAKTGRMASGEPNLQNVPRDVAYRRCFRAPPGRVLIKADYSQIELRVAARIAGEKKMIVAYRRGEDLHTLTAQQLTGRQEVTKQERQLAKPVNFGLIYGLGATSLRKKAATEYGVVLTNEQAEEYRRAFFRAWPGIADWHTRLKRNRSTETRTLSGRRVLIPADRWYGARANYAVQGTAGDGIKLALALLWERRCEMPGAFPVAVVHDEIVVEAAVDQVEAACAWVKQAMVDGMAGLLDPVPVEVEVKVATTWAGD